MRQKAEVRSEDFKAHAFLVNPELARKIWPPEQAQSDLPSDGKVHRLTAEEIEGALRANGFMIQSDQ